MLLSLKIVKAIEQEIKAQEQFIKSLENQEKNYKKDLSDYKVEVQKSIDYYKKILKDAA